MNNVTFNPLLLNVSCTGPHSEVAKIYTYILDNSFNGVLTFLGVVNSLAVIPTVVLNALIILSFLQNIKLHTPSNRLLFNLCLADLLVGILVEPVFAAHVIYISNGKHHCGLSNYLVYLIPVLIVITMVTHMAISVERYFSTHYPDIHPKVFQKRYIFWFMIFIWLACFLCFVVPFLTGDPILGTRIIVTLILVSLAGSSFCYISIYQDNKWKHGRPTAKIQGPYIVRGKETKERSVTEMEDLRENIRVSSFFFKLFLCMLITYLFNLLKNSLNSFGVFEANTHHLIHFIFDTILFLNALINPIIVLLLNDDIATAVAMTF